MKTLVARYGYFAPEDTPEHWPADGGIDSLAKLLDWLPKPGVNPRLRSSDG